MVSLPRSKKKKKTRLNIISNRPDNFTDFHSCVKYFHLK